MKTLGTTLFVTVLFVAPASASSLSNKPFTLEDLQPRWDTKEFLKETGKGAVKGAVQGAVYGRTPHTVALGAVAGAAGGATGYVYDELTGKHDADKKREEQNQRNK